jgi:hypothetical protein
MDIQELFSYQVPKLKKLVEDITEQQKQDEEDKSDTLIIDENYRSEWDRFSEFLKDLINDSHNDRFKLAIFWLLFENKELEFHEQIEQAFNYLSEYEDKVLKSMVYIKNTDEITIRFNKIQLEDQEEL